MTVVPEDSGRIKVVLTSADVKELGVSLQRIDCSDPDTRLLLRAVFKLAAYRLGKNLNHRRLLIEAYPNVSGGGILYFTPLEERTPTKRLRLKQNDSENGCFNYVFKEGDGLLEAINILYKSENTRSLPSRVYNIEDSFLLTVYGTDDIMTLHKVKEFSHHCFMGEAIKKYTREHGKALTGENAIEEIGSKISRGS